MKKIIGVILCAVFILSLATAVFASAGEAIAFTSDSIFTAGGTVKVDIQKTGANISANGTSAEKTAFSENKVQYYWMRNDCYYADGTTITLTDKDKGCQFYCVAALYSDDDHTQQCGTVTSAKFSVVNTDNAPNFPEITTKYLLNGEIGEEYYQKLECTDPDAVYSLFRSSLPDGLTLSENGEIKGTPTKTGFWYVVIMVTPKSGEEYANTAEFEINVFEPSGDYSIEIAKLPKKLTYTQGEKLDMTGLKVRIYTPDGFIDSYNGERLTYSQKELVTLGEQKIKISYEDAFEFFIVTVIAPPDAESDAVTSGDDSNAVTGDESSPTETNGITSTFAEQTEDVTDKSDITDTSSETDGNSENNTRSDGMPWWGIVLIALVSAGVGVGLTVIIIKKKK